MWTGPYSPPCRDPRHDTALVFVSCQHGLKYFVSCRAVLRIVSKDCTMTSPQITWPISQLNVLTIRTNDFCRWVAECNITDSSKNAWTDLLLILLLHLEMRLCSAFLILDQPWPTFVNALPDTPSFLLTEGKKITWCVSDTCMLAYTLLRPEAQLGRRDLEWIALPFHSI
jgi:hypothetical protein